MKRFFFFLFVIIFVNIPIFAGIKTDKILSDSGIMQLGGICGLVVKYSDEDTIAICPGYCEANGKFYELQEQTTHDLTSLVSSFNFHYIYIDDDSSEPTPDFIDSISEPTWNEVKNGWYNSVDRCIGVIASPSGSATINYFDAIDHGKNVLTKHGVITLPALCTNFSPDFTWQSPNVNESSLLTPVNCLRLWVWCSNVDAGNPIAIYFSSSEMAAINTSVSTGENNIQGYNNMARNAIITLGSSRNIKVSGADDDDNTLNTSPIGFEYSR